MSDKAPLGFQPKVRTLEEVNKDYNFHAAQAGHKARIVTEIQREIDTHIDRMLEINDEAKKLPKEVNETPVSQTAEVVPQESA